MRCSPSTVAADDPALPYPLATAADWTRWWPAAPGDGPGVAVHRRRPRPAALEPRSPTAETRWGGLDAAIAAAGVIAGGVPQWELPAEQRAGGAGHQPRRRARTWPVLRCRRCCAAPSRGRGRFLAVASAAATRGLPMLAAYCAAKAGVTGLIRALAVELGRHAASPPTRSAPGRPTPRCWPRAPGCTGCPTRAAFAAPAAARPAARPGRGRRGARLPRRARRAAPMTGAVVPVDGGLAL